MVAGPAPRCESLWNILIRTRLNPFRMTADLPQPLPSPPAGTGPSPGWLFWFPWLLGCAAFVVGELAPAWLLGEAWPTPWQWLVEARLESLVWLGLLFAGPVAWFWPTRSSRRDLAGSFSPPLPESSAKPDLLWSCGLGVLGFAVGALVGRRWSDLPPGLHDEFSYLFQAHTFLAGRTWFPSPPLRELFDQMHVLNDGRMASRYFPATGLWMAPFVWLGNPWLGWWLAQGLLTSLVFWIGRDSGGRWCGRLAGLFCALCPGLVLFSQLLLAHHPTLLGLAVMQLALPRMVRGPNRGWGILAGCGLGFAALARPMTAVGIGLPWGLWLLWRGWRDPREVRLWPWLAAPLVAAGALQLWYDVGITGSAWTTPYGEYTACHTPKHVYGFDNVRRGERSHPARRIEKYDDWAENLTPRLAMKNVAYRLFSSVQWTWGLLPVVLGLGLWVTCWKRISPPARLGLASIVSLHLVHIPYWYDGILHFHYVMESLPQWLLVLATAGCAGGEGLVRAGRRMVPLWGCLAWVVAGVLNFTTTQGLWSAPFQDGLSQFQFAREKQGQFRRLVDATVTERPALVLIQADPSDLHIDFVVNTPPLTGPILFARDRPDVASIGEIRSAWPDRTLYRYSAQTQRLARLTE